MSDRDKSKEQLIEELAALRREAAALKITKQAFDAQNELRDLRENKIPIIIEDSKGVV
ncbi:MAG: hypothetical protein EBE86_028545 [Hormoscilla sp. GUM202]|nr:hypothetical protein [Hormoscilla sp. GUM202]